MQEFDTLSNDTKAALETPKVGDTSQGNDDQAIFKLSEVIVRDYLKLDKDSPFIQQRGEEILDKLETFYKKTYCYPQGEYKSEKAFILRSLPLISSVVQLSTTIKHFNNAMDEIQKLYKIEDNPFEQATKLSYLVFTFAIDRGSQLWSQDKDRSQLWEQMRNQIAIGLLKPELTIPGKNLGDYWYNSALKYAKKVTSEAQKSENIKNSTKAAQKLRQAIFIDPNYEDTAREGKEQKFFEPIWYYLAQQYVQQIKSKRREIEITKIEFSEETIKKREIERIKKEIEDVTKKALQSLEKAIQVDSQNKKKASNEKNTTFEPIQSEPEFERLING